MPQSSGAAGFDRLGRGCLDGQRGAGVGGLKTAQNFIGRILQPCVRLVQLAGCLAGQLTQLVAIGDMRKCPKNQIGTHHEFLLQKNLCLAGIQLAPAAQQGSQHNADRPKKLPLPSFRRAKYA